MRWHGRRSHNQKTVGERGIMAKGEGGVIGLDEANPKVPEVHFVQPTKENLSVIARDCSRRLYLRLHLHFSTQMERPVMEEFTRLVVNTGGPAVMNANTTAMKTEEMTIIRLFSHALRRNTMVATTTSTRVRVCPSRDGSKRSSIICKTLMQSRSTPALMRYTGIRQLHELALRHREEVRGHGDMLDVVDGRADHSLVQTMKAASKVERFSRRV